MSEIIAVDMYDNQIGIVTKIDGHSRPILHRAFSVFLYQEDKMLIQKRSPSKYHSPSLWTNACCSHPQPDEVLTVAVERRLNEELGISCSCEKEFSFIYYNKFSENLYEYEYDHVFIGEYNGLIKINTDEVEQVKWVQIDELATDLVLHPQKFSVWFLISAPRIIEKIKGGYLYNG